MCITFWYTPPAGSSGSSIPGLAGSSSHRRPTTSPYAFILLSNRDLELGRPAFDARWHDFEPIDVHPHGQSKVSAGSSSIAGANIGRRRKIISGRDAADPVGGTWLGMGSYDASTAGAHARVGVLTNIHDDSPVPKGTKTRGSLIKDWLKGAPCEGDSEDETRRYLEGLKEDAVKLAGFNLLLFDIDLSAAPAFGDAAPPRVRRVAARQLTNRFRPHRPASCEASSIPADTSSLTTSTTARLLPESPNPRHATTSPLGMFQSAITELTPSALRMGGMSNSLLEEPFVKVRDGIRAFEGIVKRELESGVDWDEARERALLEKLFGLMGETHPVTTFQDLERAICVPLCMIPLPGMTGTLYQPPHQSHHGVHDDHPNAHDHRGRAASVNAHTMLGTPIITPEGSPAGTASPLPTLQEETLYSQVPGMLSEPDRRASTPESHESMSAPAGHKPYGTRLTTIILVTWDGRVTYTERDVWWMDAVGCVHKGGTEDRAFTFQL
ncbi:hypothetical protein NliqN6_3090 [Naganishia liquefaciens]|uniref:NRDE family protein n=1 Tax=Naganishia liquefaciens TaxID=104408 RepID=A0A8H3TTN9_9TREE|nr:hypothetical protein NliqN6_3090 [Naganishia liquefaciens]